MSTSAGSETKRGLQEAHAEWQAIVGVIVVCLLIGAAVGWFMSGLFKWTAIGLSVGVLIDAAYVLLMKWGRVYWRVATANLSQPGEAPRNHIICIDGTSMFKQKRGNVYRFYDLVQDECKRYYRGVGVKDNKGVAYRVHAAEHGMTLVGGATGHGATALLRLAYFDFVNEYRPGDRIYIFGFSRGAAIARVLANWICSPGGLPESVKIQCLRQLVREDAVLDIDVTRPATKHTCQIEMMGLWDTVAGFGYPLDKNEPFDFALSSGVRKAYHLVAIDETRKAFDVTLMERDDQDDRVEEIWFAGAHGNVGGGLLNSELSDIALRFMMNRASENGINFKKDANEFQELFKIKSGKRPDISKLFWDAGWVWGPKTTREIRVQKKPGALPLIHKSVFELKEALELAGSKKYLQNVPDAAARNAYTPDARD